MATGSQQSQQFVQDLTNQLQQQFKQLGQSQQGQQSQSGGVQSQQQQQQWAQQIVGKCVQTIGAQLSRSGNQQTQEIGQALESGYNTIAQQATSQMS